MNDQNEQTSQMLQINDEKSNLSKYKDQIEKEQITIRTEMAERSKGNECLVKKQREFLKGIKKDVKTQTIIDNLNDQTDKNLDTNQNVISDQQLVHERSTEQSTEQPKSKLIYVNKNNGDQLIDLHKTNTMNSRKLLQSIISRNLLTKIHLPNLHLSTEDINEDEQTIDKKRTKFKNSKFRKDNSVDNSRFSSKNSSRTNSINNSRDNSRDGSNDSLNDVDSLKDSISSKNNNRKRNNNGKRKNKRQSSKDDLMDEKENQDDLTCSSEPIEILNEREKKRSIGYPGLAFGTIFSSNTMMRFRLISNELHNIQNVQLKRVKGFKTICKFLS